MEDQELCKKFLDADKIINDENDNNLTMYQIINDPEFDKYCPKSKCETNIQRIGALSAYLFMKARVLATNVMENYGQYDEFFLMWLSDKLFKIAKEDNNPLINEITLYKAYEQHLKNNIVSSNYLDLLDKINGLKEVNLMYMKHFYKLLNLICKVIAHYNPNDKDNNKLINYSTECYNQYSSLYDSVSQCISYLHLLDNLKKTYYSFINNVINQNGKNEELAWDLKTLKTSDGEDDYFSKDFNNFDFSDSKCKLEIKLPPEPQSASQKSGTSPQSGTKDSGTQKGNSDSEGDRKGGTNNLSGSTGSGHGSETGDTSGGSSSGASGGQNDQGGSNDGPKALGDQVPTPPSGEPNGYLLSNWGMSFNLMGYMPSASSIYQSSKNILSSATNKISDTYNNTVDIVKGAYDSTVNNIKDAYDRTMTSITGAYNNAMTSITNAYDRTTNYIGNAVNSVTSQLNPFSTPQSDDNQPGSNSSGGGTDTSNHSQQNPPPPTPPSPSLPSPVTPPDPQNPSLSQPQDPPQTPSLSQPHSNQTQDKLQITVQNDASNTLKQPDPKTGTGGVQTMTITNDTLPSSSTDPSITGSGITTGIVVKMIEKPSIWCIAQNKKYNILSICIISISIFAFLAIMYKYLSLGCTSKSKRKKNMKKVINSIGGKKPVQIIIKSYDRSKDLKPIINSVGRKKDPLLNIYKLMQADPIPFINLFFLLIFFVYKRKYDFLEL
ncbi:CIR protein PIR protein [Plasmodium vinckei brucechwatti]|uniref:CIR protein PIR protein n=1 Tax=Plasmodium vinckei brucechwatti TaxID=119398 RepID=A0A6V7S284_PLAVN|nr:CIR protein PIR protein [Plasmodium vinckei brucechwatti]